MTAAHAAQWAVLLAFLALLFLAVGQAVGSRAASLVAAVSAGIATVLYAIAIIA